MSPAVENHRRHENATPLNVMLAAFTSLSREGTATSNLRRKTPVTRRADRLGRHSVTKQDWICCRYLSNDRGLCGVTGRILHATTTRTESALRRHGRQCLCRPQSRHRTAWADRPGCPHLRRQGSRRLAPLPRRPRIGIADAVQLIPYTGENPIDYVMSKNLHRRQLSASQCTAIVVAAAAWAERGCPAAKKSD